MDEARGILRYLVVMLLVIAIVAEFGWVIFAMAAALDSGSGAAERAAMVVIGVAGALVGLLLIVGLAVALTRLGEPETEEQQP